MGRVELVIGIAKYGYQMYKWLRAEQKERQKKKQT